MWYVRLRERGQILFHIATKEQYFTIPSLRGIISHRASARYFTWFVIAVFTSRWQAAYIYIIFHSSILLIQKTEPATSEGSIYILRSVAFYFTDESEPSLVPVCSQQNGSSLFWGLNPRPKGEKRRDIPDTQRKTDKRSIPKLRMVVVSRLELEIQEPKSCVIPISPYHNVQGWCFYGHILNPVLSVVSRPP